MTCYPQHQHHPSGFTLIELSIVLVIIGLLVGAIMVGQDLIHGAAIRAQISQIEKYKSAMNTFRTKYNNDLPGDMPATDAAAFGFATRAGSTGRGDGNGLLEGSATGSSNVCGETGLFWNDLMTAGLIGEYISTTVTATIAQGDTDGDLLHCPASNSANPSFSSDGLLPPAKLRPSSYLTVYSESGYNYFQITGNVGLSNSGQGMIYLPAGPTTFTKPGLSPLESKAIDTKIDDGYPTTGTIISRDPTTFSNTAPPGAGAAGTASAGDCGDNPPYMCS